MEVTKQNFESVLSTLENVFKKASFLSLDTEFTGLKVEGAAGLNYFSTLEDLYAIDRLKVEKFMAVQIGIVAFFYNKETKKYSHQAYNFYVYPSTFSDINFTCQSKSIEFLVENGFDFNKVFGSGIPFLKDSEVDELVSKLNDKFQRTQSNDSLFISEIPSEIIPVVNTVMSKIEIIVKEKTKSTFTTERFNGFVRRIIYSEVLKKYGNKVFIQTNRDETMLVHVGFEEEEIKEKKLEKFALEKKKIMKEYGFSEVIKMIMNSGKLLLGHNLLIDLMFVIRQFLIPLPETYADFKDMAHFLFSKLVDTKYLAGAPEFSVIKDTALPTVIEHFVKLESLPSVEIAKNGHGYDINEKKHHEAAYDAYLTGLAFLAMCKVLGVSLENPSESVILKSKLNKLSVPRMKDITHMNLAGPDPEPDRKGVYHLTFPKEWKKENVMELFQDYGFMNMAWIDSTSAFIKVKYESVADVERKLMKSKSNSVYKIITYNDYHRQHHSVNDKTSESKAESRKFEKNKGNSGDGISFTDLSTICDSQEIIKKRQIEDIGEVIERPCKKQSV